MYYADVAIPLGFAWSSPFAKWQGTLAEVSSLDLAGRGDRPQALADRGRRPRRSRRARAGLDDPPARGRSTARRRSPRGSARPGVTGPMVAQACATSVAALAAAAGAVAAGGGAAARRHHRPDQQRAAWSTPRRAAMGGAPVTSTGCSTASTATRGRARSMIAAAETVAAEDGITRDGARRADAAALRSSTSRALADDRAFQRRYQVPVELPAARGDAWSLDADEGVRPTTAEGLGQAGAGRPRRRAHLRRRRPTRPTAAPGAVVTTAAQARELGRRAGIVRLLGVGFARVEKSRDAQGAGARRRARRSRGAGLTLADVDAITTHNPFAVNDLFFARETGFPLERMNAYGCSLVFGHPQAPTGLRVDRRADRGAAAARRRRRPVHRLRGRRHRRRARRCESTD